MPRPSTDKNAQNDIIKPRQTQAQRSDAMRDRLCSAAIQQLVEKGYAHTSVTAICRRAGVSRGAFLHHYPAKQDMIDDVARTLMNESQRRLGRVLLEVADESNRVEALVEGAWEEIFNTPRYQAYMELLNASQSDPELTQLLQSISRDVLKMLDQAVAHYFEPVSADSFKPKAIFILSQWLLAGITNQRHLIDSPEYIRYHLDIWKQLLITQIRPRKGVTGPPPDLLPF